MRRSIAIIAILALSLVLLVALADGSALRSSNPLPPIRSRRSFPPLRRLTTPANDRYLRVVSIDGGGVRGIIAAQQLVALEKKIQQRRPGANLSDYVDVVGGTSTGGVMALCILAGYNATQVAQTWYDGAPQVFAKSMRNWFGPAVDSAYKPANLELMLQKVLGNDTLMSKFRDRSYAIVAFDIGNSREGVFTRDSVNERGDFRAWKVGRATSAAPTYFPTAYIDSETNEWYTYVDGGVMANNPSSVVLSVAENDYRQYNFNQTALLSIGCGTDDTTVSGSKDWGYTPWYFEGKIVDLMIYGPQIAVDDAMIRRFSTAGIPSQYARIQYDKRAAVEKLPACTEADFSMDNVDPKNIELLQSCGQQIAIANDALLERYADYFVMGQP